LNFHLKVKAKTVLYKEMIVFRLDFGLKGLFICDRIRTKRLMHKMGLYIS